jgi:threonine synthase
MNISGRTPLFRAKKIESELGVKEIYLKLEGANPFGNKFDRITEVLVNDAKIQNKKFILVDGSQDYINSMIYFANRSDIGVKIPLFNNERWKRNKYEDSQLVNVSNLDFDSKRSFIEKYCIEHDYYNGASGHYQRHLSTLALENIGNEITSRLGEISAVFTQLSYGYTVSSLYNGFVRKWVQGEIEKYPKIISATIPKGNLIFDDYRRNFQLEDLENYDININKYTKHLFINESILLEETLRAVHDTGGTIISIDEKLLKQSASYLREKEYINLTTEEAYSFAGFYKMAKEGKLSNGKYVIILNNGKSELEIEEVKDFNTYSLDMLIKFVRDWLLNYKDSVEETRDALLNAMEKGYIYVAKRGGEVQGICVVVNIGFEAFIPKYHLAFIATNGGNKGRGIATELIGQAVEATEGNLSLHIDLDNTRAAKLYKKLGFKHKYNRMIYYGN